MSATDRCGTVGDRGLANARSAGCGGLVLVSQPEREKLDSAESTSTIEKAGTLDLNMNMEEEAIDRVVGDDSEDRYDFRRLSVIDPQRMRDIYTGQ